MSDMNILVFLFNNHKSINVQKVQSSSIIIKLLLLFTVNKLIIFTLKQTFLLFIFRTHEKNVRSKKSNRNFYVLIFTFSRERKSIQTQILCWCKAGKKKKFIFLVPGQIFDLRFIKIQMHFLAHVIISLQSKELLLHENNKINLSYQTFFRSIICDPKS